MRLQVIIETPDNRNVGKFRELLRNSFELSDSLEYDYQAIVNGAKALFPNIKLLIHLNVTVL